MAELGSAVIGACHVERAGRNARPTRRRCPMFLAPTRLPVAVLALATLLGAASVPHAHAQGIPGVAPNKCLAGKNKCVTTKIAGLMKCRGLCQQAPDKCGQVQTECEQKVIDKFDGGDTPEKGCFAKLEAKQKPEKPDSICVTTGDTAQVEAQADALANALLLALEPPCPPITCLNGGTLKAGCSCNCPSGYESLHGGCFQITGDGFPFCGGDCAGVGSIDGSGNFLCVHLPRSTPCSSTSECALGSACYVPVGGCVAQCTSP
jgi:hypothetical protein